MMVFLCFVAASGTVAIAADRSPQVVARQILDATAVRGGLIVHVGCGQGELTAALRRNDAYLVQGLDSDSRNVAAARRRIAAFGLDGKVSIDSWSGERLPYADNLVNLLVSEDLGGVLPDEVLRVLAPRGTAYVKQAGVWETIIKPWSGEIDEWSHFLHDASGNAVAHDRVVADPRRLQWIDGPLWSRSHEYDSSLSAMVSSQGRLFAIFDEGMTGIIDPRIPDKWMLIARDAFNGVVLWKRAIADWGWTAYKRASLEKLDWRHLPSQRCTLPLSLPRRLVAAGDRLYVTLGYHAPLVALDAATGQTLLTYEGSENTDEILYHAGQLLLCIRAPANGLPSESALKARSRPIFPSAVIAAIDAATGHRLWRSEAAAVAPLSLARNSGNVFYRDQEAVVCLDAASGRQRWRTVVGRDGGSLWNSDATLVAYGKVVLWASRQQLVALSVVEGKVLWQLPGASGFGVVNPPDLFVADGLVWYAQGRPELESITGYDPLTGKPLRTINMASLLTRGHHARCYRSKATDNYLFLPKRGVELLDVKGGEQFRDNWVRGACRYGILPCNGLLYATPHPCFCYAGVKLGGFVALAPGKDIHEKKPAAKQFLRIDRGPAYEEPGIRPSGQPSVAACLPSAEDWPAYRHDARLSGSTATPVEGPLGQLWKRQLGGKLTQPVVAGGRLYVARVDAGQICCLDSVTGAPLWDFTVAGRIDSSPTCYQGRLLFGSADGSVYCLRASDGVLAWRLHATPEDRRVVAFGQVESAWPIHGSLLVVGDTAYFAVGRSSFLDGGIFLYGIDPLTGRKRYETCIDGPRPDTKVLDESAYAMEGAKSDLLVSDGKLIYLFHNAFDTRLQKQPTPVLGQPGVRNLGEREFGEHLFSNGGLLDDSWFSRNHWMHGNLWTAFNFAHQAPKAGEILVFDDATTYAVKCFVRRNLLSPLFFPATDGYFLVADSNDTQPVVVNPRQQANYLQWLPQDGPLQKCWNLDVGFARGSAAKWTTDVPVRMRALVRTQNALFAAGPPDVCEQADPLAALEGRRGAILLSFDRHDGRKLAERKLDSPPVFDGLSAAAGRLYLATLDGAVQCLGASHGQ